MEYLIGKAKTLGSTHKDDKGTSLKVVSGAGSRHYLILDGGEGDMGVVRLQGITHEVLFIAALENPPQYSKRLEIQLRDNDWLTVYSSTRGDPYREGVTITVGAHPYSEDMDAKKVSVFVEDADVRRLRKAIAWRDGKSSGTLVVTTKRVEV